MDEVKPRRLDDSVLYPAIQRLIATMPPQEAFTNRLPDIAPWVGEAFALLERWNSSRAFAFRMSIANIGTALDFGSREYPAALAILHEARYDVELRAEAPTSGFVDKGKVHDFFEHVRGLVQQAKADLLVADRYLNAEFVARYLPFVTRGAGVRLLVRRPEQTLLPALEPAARQYGLQVQLRTHDEVHDRFLFVDAAACYHFGASFADGGKTGPTTIIPLADFAEIQAKYEAMWNGGVALR
jgi:hypothetical protein